MRLRKGLASRCWENLVLAMLGEQFMVGEEICGAVVSIRFQVCLLINLNCHHHHVGRVLMLVLLHVGGHNISLEQNSFRSRHNSKDPGYIEKSVESPS